MLGRGSDTLRYAHVRPYRRPKRCRYCAYLRHADSASKRGWGSSCFRDVHATVLAAQHFLRQLLRIRAEHLLRQLGIALLSTCPAQCQLRSPTAAEPLQTYLLAKLRRKKRPLSSCPPSCLSDSRERTKYGRCGSNANGLPDLCGFFVVMTARESFKKARLQGWKLRGLAAARPETPAEPQSRYDSRSTSQFSTSIL